MTISKPELPPAPQGYVEDVDFDGVHYYRKLPEQVEKEIQTVSIQALTTQLAQSDDAAISLYESQSATDEAVLALYQKIGG